MILVALLIVILFAVFGAPLFLVLGAAALLGYLSSGQDLMLFFASNFVQVSTNPIFLAIPLFTLAGFLLSESGAPTRLVNLTKAFFGWMPGGLAIVSLLACAFFTAFTGVSGVTIIALGGLLYPIIIKDGYPEKFTLGLLTTSGSRGLLFPPSLPLIIYAMIAGLSLQGIEEFKVHSLKDETKTEAAIGAGESAGDEIAEKKQSDEDLLKEFDIDIEKVVNNPGETERENVIGEGAGAQSALSAEREKMHQLSVDNLFVAGAVPGFLMILIVGAYSVFFARKSNVKRTKFDFRYVLKAVREALWEIPVPVIIIAGIYGGFFTAIDAAAITAFYIFVVEVLIYRDIRINRLPAIFRESMLLVGGIMLILLSALSLTNFFIDAEVPQNIFSFIKSHIDSRFTFLLMLNIFLLIVGCLMDIYSAILVVVPIIVPVALFYEVDPVHLAIIFLVNLEIGFSTPPVGVNLFVAALRFDRSIIELYSAAVPYLILMLIGLTLITYIPALSLFLL